MRKRMAVAVTLILVGIGAAGLVAIDPFAGPSRFSEVAAAILDARA